MEVDLGKRSVVASVVVTLNEVALVEDGSNEEGGVLMTGMLDLVTGRHQCQLVDTGRVCGESACSGREREREKWKWESLEWGLFFFFFFLWWSFFVFFFGPL